MLALSSVSVMRIGITVPAARVTVFTTSGGGGGGGARHHLHRIGSRSSRRRRRRWGRRRSLRYFLMPPLFDWRRWSHLGRACRRNHQIINHRSYPIDRRTIGRRQRAGRVIVDLAIQRSHTVRHTHLNILTRQRRLARDLSLNVAANLLVTSHRRRCRLRVRRGVRRRLLCHRSRFFRREERILAARAQNQETSQNCQRDTAEIKTENQSSWGNPRFSVLVADHPSQSAIECLPLLLTSFDERRSANRLTRRSLILATGKMWPAGMRGIGKNSQSVTRLGDASGFSCIP